MERNTDSSIEALQDIRNIMERSARFISLSGWSGVWAGVVAVIGAGVAYSLIEPEMYNMPGVGALDYTDSTIVSLIKLACVVLVTAVVGAFYFTMRKVKRQGGTLWNMASRQLMLQMAIPLIAGGFFVLALLHYGDGGLIAPACLTFYGLALVNGSKYTLSDIRYLGISEIILGIICIFFPGYGLYFWALGFGVLHIIYGIIMWNKYDKQ